MVSFSTRIPNCDSHSSALLDLFISSDGSICSTILKLFLSQIPSTFHHIQSGMPCFIVLLMTILMQIGTIFMII